MSGPPHTGAEDRILRQFSGYGMKRAFHRIQTDLNNALAPLGLRMMTFSALAVVVEHPGLRQAKLADVLAIERPNLVLILDELERMDLITRDRDTLDRRAYALNPTLEGRRLLHRAERVVHAHERRMTAGLTPAQRDSMIATLRVIENGPPTRSEETEHGPNLSGA